jgi:hypothetical protein
MINQLSSFTRHPELTSHLMEFRIFSAVAIINQ